MGLTLTLPTPGAGNGTWGTTLNENLNAINDGNLYLIKTADGSGATTNTTLADDNQLTGLTVGVGTWVVSATFFATGAAAGDIKIAWAHSGTFTGHRGGIGPSAGVTSVLTGAGAGTRTAAAADTATTITTGAIYATDGTNITTIIETGILVVTVSGTFKIQMAQGSSSGTATLLKAGSFVTVRKVAS
jgi:hypothetical protein